MADPKTNTTTSAPATAEKKERAKPGQGKQRNLGPKGVAKSLRASVNRTNKLLAQAKKESLKLELGLDPEQGVINLGQITFSESF